MQPFSFMITFESFIRSRLPFRPIIASLILALPSQMQVAYYLLFSKIMTAPFRSNCLVAVGLVERANYLSCRPATVVMPSLSVSAFYCPATVEAASALSPALSVQLQIACLFLRSSVPILDSNTITLQSLACRGTKTWVIASVTAFSHNLGLGCQSLRRVDHNVMPQAPSLFSV